MYSNVHGPNSISYATRTKKIIFLRSSTTDKLCQMESLLPAWKTLESRLEQLQKDLREDEKTIHLLDSCLTNGTFTDQTATCVRDVAKVLSETTAHQVGISRY